MTSRRTDRPTLAAFVLLVFLGGSATVALRQTLGEMAPFWSAALRWAIAGGLLLVVVLGTRRSLPRGRELVGTALYGFLSFGLFNLFLYPALQVVPAGTAQVILATVPLFTLVLAVGQRLEPFRALGLLGMVIAAVGITFIFSGQTSLDVPVLAMLALIASALCAAESSVAVKRFGAGDPLAAAAIGMLLGVPLLLVASLFTGELWALPSSTDTWLAFGYLVLAGSVLLFPVALSILGRWPATTLSYGFLLFPVVTLVLGAAVLHEPIEPGVVVGGTVVVVGVYVGAFYRPGSAGRMVRQALSRAARPG